MDVNWRRSCWNTQVVYLGQNQLYLNSQLSKFLFRPNFKYLVYSTWSIWNSGQGTVWNRILPLAWGLTLEVGHSANTRRAKNYTDVQLNNVRLERIKGGWKAHNEHFGHYEDAAQATWQRRLTKLAAAEMVKSRMENSRVARQSVQEWDTTFQELN